MQNSVGLKGRFDVQVIRDGEVIRKISLPNAIVDVGMNNILDVMFSATAQSTLWYVGLINNASYSALAAADTMASHAGWIESAHYSQATRPQWTVGAAAARACTNAATVDFTMNDTVTIKGVFITTVNTKSGVTGTLWATAAFGSTVALTSGDSLKITYTVTGS